jgi:hypothetical protein
MGDAGEMLVAAELTLAGVPALKVPDNWPHYDVIAQPLTGEAQMISVKTRTFKRGAAFVKYNETDKFDWLAVVIIPADIEPKRRIFLIPRNVADQSATRDRPTAKTAHERYFRIDRIAKLFAVYEENYCLNPMGEATRR